MPACRRPYLADNMMAMGIAAPALMALIASTGLALGEFVGPAEGPVPFRRDRLPIDTDAMRDLSREVFGLAGGIKPTTPKSQRDLAQVLALALALDPANRAARSLLNQLQDSGGGTDTAGTSEGAEEARAKLQEMNSWLSDVEAGDDANSLALCILDVISTSAEGERGKWSGWIPDLASYQPKKKEPEVKPTPPVAPEKSPAAEIKPTPLATAEVFLPVRKSAKEAAIQLVSLKMKGTTGNPGDGPALRLAGDKGGKLAAYDVPIHAALAQRLGPFPAGLNVDLSLPEGDSYDFAANGMAISGAAAVLLDAAVSGQAPAKTIVFATVGTKRALEIPPHFWTTLRSMPASPAVRLIVPKTAAEYLTSLLTLDGPAFFLSHEVLMAENVDEMCSLAKGGETSFAEASTRFTEIQRAAAGKPIGVYLAKPEIVTRLEQIAAAMPSHASARLLALQGSGNRPRYLPRPILAQEIRTALEPLEYVKNTTLADLQTGQLEVLHDQCRQALERLTSYIDIRDREMQKEAVITADNLRSLAKVLKMNESTRYYDLTARREDAYAVATKGYKDTMAKLTEVAGDADEYRKAAPPPSE
jgi:hypothetical protein